MFVERRRLVVSSRRRLKGRSVPCMANWFDFETDWTYWYERTVEM